MEQPPQSDTDDWSKVSHTELPVYETDTEDEQAEAGAGADTNSVGSTTPTRTPPETPMAESVLDLRDLEVPQLNAITTSPSPPQHVVSLSPVTPVLVESESVAVAESKTEQPSPLPPLPTYVPLTPSEFGLCVLGAFLGGILSGVLATLALV